MQVSDEVHRLIAAPHLWSRHLGSGLNLLGNLRHRRGSGGGGRGLQA
jgi:hypothetical protein